MNKIKTWSDSYLYQKQTGGILNHLTLQISNPEVKSNFYLHQSMKFDRTLWFSIVWTVGLMIKDVLTKGNNLLVVQHSIVIAIYLIYKVMRKKLTNSNRLYEWAVFLSITAIVIISTLINARVLPGKSLGLNPKSTPSTG